MSRFFRVYIFAVLVVSFSLSCVKCQNGNSLPNQKTDVQSPSKGEVLDLVLVAENPPWMMALASPVVTRVGQGKDLPYLMAFSYPVSPSSTSLLRQVSPKNALVMYPDKNFPPALGIDQLKGELVHTGRDPFKVSSLLARRFWGKSSTLVLASALEPGAILQASALASHLSCPLILFQSRLDKDPLMALLKDLQTSRILHISFSTQKAALWLKETGAEVETLDAKGAEEKLIQAIGVDKLLNIVLVRIPEELKKVGNTSWLAPYYSLIRKSLVVLAETEDPNPPEKHILGLIEKGAIKPRSLTILADHSSLTMNSLTIPVEDKNLQEGFVFPVEPCVLEKKDFAQSLAVGRIPTNRLDQASALLVRGFYREKHLPPPNTRILLVANPNPKEGPLPLGETISRSTGAAFKNFGLKITEFFGTPSNDAKILAQADEAHLILFEGHLFDQKIFEDESTLLPENPASQGGAAQRVPPLTPEKNPLPKGSQPPVTEPVNPLQPEAGNVIQQFASKPPAKAPRILKGMPVIFLQSCKSLEDLLANRIYEMGGIALVGSVTNIHSASGGTFLKALCNGLLYRGDTLGEALRDALNYYLCLQKLKNLRGHKEQAKGLRVAYSFRLWGDPELRIFPLGMKPIKKPLSFKWISENKLAFKTPKLRLKAIETEKYLYRAFPKNHAAGIVRKIKGKTYRKLLPLYFFRIPLPAQFPKKGYTGLKYTGKKARGVFKIDTQRKYLYVLYFPKKEKAAYQYQLEFQK